MMIFYSYIGPIFTTAIKRNQPETAEETYTQTVSILKNTSPNKSAKMCKDYFWIW